MCGVFLESAPLFWAGLLFYWWHPGPWGITFAPNGTGWPHIAATFFFVHGWYPTTINSIVPGGWSIGAEVMFYLCIPLLHKRIISLSGAIWMTLATTFAVCAGTPIATRLLAPHFPASWSNLIRDFLFWSFPTQLPVFCLGFVLYFILVRQMTHAGGGMTNKRHWSILFLAIAAFVMVYSIPDHIIYAGAFALIAWGLAIHPMRIFVNRVTRYIGVVSYSVYIWHFWILDHLAPRILPLVNPIRWDKLNGTVQFFVLYALIVAVSVAMASVSYYLIELPSQRLGKSVISWMGWGAAPKASALRA